MAEPSTALSNTELTVAAIVEQNSRFLVVEEMVHGKKVINQPAGHVEDGESLIEAVVRETIEETAWHFKPEAITGIYLYQHPASNSQRLRVTFCGTCTQHEPDRVLDDGIIRALWLRRDELIAQPERLRSVVVLRSIDDYLQGTRYPQDLIQELRIEKLALQAAVI